MPKATVDPATHHRDLKTCEGGYVELRTLSFHEMEMRKDIAGRMYSEQLGQSDDSSRAYFESMNVAVTEFEFSNCIVSHNLFVDDAETQKIDFTKPMLHWKLDPKIGEEISGYITELTQISEKDMRPLPTAPSSSYLDGASTPKDTLVG